MRTRLPLITLFSLAGILLIPLGLFTDTVVPGAAADAPAVAVTRPLATSAMRRVAAFNIPVLPETGTLAVVGTTLIGLAAIVRRRR